jgi:hypothetical protein
MAPALLAAGFVLPACAPTHADEVRARSSAVVKHVEGSDVARITLSRHAARRLDVQTTRVRGRAASVRQRRLIIPYAAILYDPTGHTWTYTSPKPLEFVRAPIRIDHIDGRKAILSSGPHAGTKVVTVGVAELLGIEYAVGEE